MRPRPHAGRWSGRVLWPGDTLALPETGIELPPDELYADLDPDLLRTAE